MGKLMHTTPSKAWYDVDQSSLEGEEYINAMDGGKSPGSASSGLSTVSRQEERHRSPTKDWRLKSIGICGQQRKVAKVPGPATDRSWRQSKRVK